jgi:hypothetical protein
MRWPTLIRWLTGIFLSAVILFCGFHWRVDFNLDSGRERKCQCLFNFAIWRGEPEATIISRALGPRNDGVDWLQVQDGPYYLRLINPSYPRMLGQFHRSVNLLEINEVRDERLPRSLAEWVMDDLRAGRDCYWTWRRLERFQKLLGQAWEKDEDLTLDFDQVRSVWLQSAS